MCFFDRTSSFAATNINCATSYPCIRCCLNEEDFNDCRTESRKRSLSDVRGIGIDKALVIGCSKLLCCLLQSSIETVGTRKDKVAVYVCMYN